MEFSEIVAERHAAKNFTGASVPAAKIAELEELIRLAPTSFNVQPWRARVVSDAATKEALLPHSWNQPQVTACSHLFVFCADTELEPLVDKLEAALAASGNDPRKTRGYIGLVRQFVGSLAGPARLAWAQRQVYIALAHGMLGAKALGYDSCPIEGFEPPEYARVLDLPAQLVATVVLAVGVSEETVRPKLRFPPEDLFF